MTVPVNKGKKKKRQQTTRDKMRVPLKAKEARANRLDEMKKKLVNLREHMPGKDDAIYEFAQMLAKKLDSPIVPTGFVMAAELLIVDLMKGYDGCSGERIDGDIAGNPPLLLLIRMSIPDIAKATCPPDFAKKVAKFMETYAK